MSQELLYSAAGIALFGIGIYGVINVPHILRKILAINIAGVGVFMFLVAIAHSHSGYPDPVPHAMVLTGIVVAVAGTALALWLVSRIQAATDAGEGETNP